MNDKTERRHWFGTGQRPRLPAKLRVEPGHRLRGLDEFEQPAFVRSTSRVQWRHSVGWWALIVAGFAAGVALEFVLLN